MSLAQLLYRSESESLDFKRSQYPFVSADDRTKSELLKDILAMANSWRTEPAHILIGIDASAHPPQVAGITNHFDDAILQQFVNGKTQRPLKFSYYAAELQGLPIGVIEIPVQSRPIFLKKDYGKLKANTVYIRRGSSTDEASPDEIALMGAKSATLKDSDIQIHFAIPASREIKGNQVHFDSHIFHIKEGDNIPDFRPPPPKDIFYVPDRISKPNIDFYRELVQGVTQNYLLQKVALTVTNNGTLAAKEIRIEFVLPDQNRIWEFCDESDFVTEVPKRYKSFYDDNLLRITAARRNGEPGYEFCYIDGQWHLTFEFGYLQPGRTLWPALEFYVGARQTGTVSLQGRVMADGLPAAATCKVEFSAKVTESETSLGELMQNYDAAMEPDESD